MTITTLEECSSDVRTNNNNILVVSILSFSLIVYCRLLSRNRFSLHTLDTPGNRVTYARNMVVSQSSATHYAR